MKKIFAFTMIIALSAPMLQSCSSRKASGGILSGTGGSIGKTVITAIGAILLVKILKSVLGNVLGNQSFASLSQNNSFQQNFNENTPLNSFANNEVLKTALQLLVSHKYEIPLTTVTNNYRNFNTVGDLATFIGQNASVDALKQIQAQ